ncbi:MAG: polymerase sigma-70 factor, subfamily, partial [Candidatus Binatota bacterium]|nr:polymerase sigma-70 factor, subfamily [Candidatus Binatota bacterium]
ASGALVLLEDQDRQAWDHDAVAEGLALLERALALRGRGPYVLQAAIAAEHARAATAAETDWEGIAGLYDRLAEIDARPVVALNRAVAVAMARGPEAGLGLVDELEEPLHGYHLFHAARADLLRRLERRDEAADAYIKALSLTDSEVERDFLARRLHNIKGLSL